MKTLLAIILFAVTFTATGQEKVYVTPNGSKYHKAKDCHYLKRSEVVLSISLDKAKEALTECSKCYQTATNYELVTTIDTLKIYKGERGGTFYLDSKGKKKYINLKKD